MIRKTIFLFFLWIEHSIRYTDGACDVKFVKIGCFFDDMVKPRPVPELLFSDRDGSSGHSIGWNKWDSYLDDVTCRCAKKAAERRFVYFSLQFYGECWSGENAVASFPRAGKSEHCVSKGFEKCVERSKKNCVGESRSNFVYMLSSHDTMCHYKGVGCFNNNYEEPRPFPNLLFSDCIHSPKYSNVTLDLIKWNTYILDLACRCAAATRKHKYKRFSLQDFGECWSGPNLEPAVFMSEEEGVCLGQGFQHCSKNDRVCVVQCPEERKMFNFKVNEVLSLLMAILMLLVHNTFARGGRKGGGRSGRPRARMKKKLCCGGLAGVDSSGKKLPDWMVAILVFLVVIALYMMYALMRWIYVKRLQGKLFRYREGIDRSEICDASSHV